MFAQYALRLQYSLFQRKERLLNILPVRLGWLWFALCRHGYNRFLRKDYYLALAALLRYERDVACLVGEASLGNLYKSVVHNFMTAHITGTQNRALDSWARSEQGQQIRDIFHSFEKEQLLRMRYPKKNLVDPGRQGDLIILKPYLGPKEKGVLFVQYDEGVQRFCALYDVARLAKKYRFVVEPSTSGYQNPMLLLLLSLDTEVIIEAQYEPDSQYVEQLGCNYRSIRLGAGDWADPELFEDGSLVEKQYDIVMIANWLSWKRHKLFFENLALCRNSIKKVAVIGYPTGGRTLAHIKEECEQHKVSDLVDFYEKIPPRQVGEILRQSKCGILLSKDEGANRGIYECFFSGIPIILSAANRGVNRDHITPEVGVVASDDKLAEVMAWVTEHYKEFSPRQWALSNTGYINSTQKLNSFLRELSLNCNEQWTQDIFTKHNSPHARFAYAAEQQVADEAVPSLEEFLRPQHLA